MQVLVRVWGFKVKQDMQKIFIATELLKQLIWMKK